MEYKKLFNPARKKLETEEDWLGLKMDCRGLEQRLLTLMKYHKALEMLGLLFDEEKEYSGDLIQFVTDVSVLWELEKASPWLKRTSEPTETCIRKILAINPELSGIYDEFIC